MGFTETVASSTRSVVGNARLYMPTTLLGWLAGITGALFCLAVLSAFLSALSFVASAVLLCFLFSAVATSFVCGILWAIGFWVAVTCALAFAAVTAGVFAGSVAAQCGNYTARRLLKLVTSTSSGGSASAGKLSETNTQEGRYEPSPAAMNGNMPYYSVDPQPSPSPVVVTRDTSAMPATGPQHNNDACGLKYTSPQPLRTVPEADSGDDTGSPVISDMSGAAKQYVCEVTKGMPPTVTATLTPQDGLWNAVANREAVPNNTIPVC